MIEALYGGHMFKRIGVLLGLAAVGVGLFIIAVNHSKDMACNTGHGPFSNYGVSNRCIHVVWSYFGGFALIVGGLIVILIGLASMRQSARSKRGRRTSHATGIELWESARRFKRPEN